jgi:hypothetical protein
MRHEVGRPLLELLDENRAIWEELFAADLSEVRVPSRPSVCVNHLPSTRLSPPHGTPKRYRVTLTRCVGNGDALCVWAVLTDKI